MPRGICITTRTRRHASSSCPKSRRSPKRSTRAIRRATPARVRAACSASKRLVAGFSSTTGSRRRCSITSGASAKPPTWGASGRRARTRLVPASSSITRSAKPGPIDRSASRIERADSIFGCELFRGEPGPSALPRTSRAPAQPCPSSLAVWHDGHGVSAYDRIANLFSCELRQQISEVGVEVHFLPAWRACLRPRTTSLATCPRVSCRAKIRDRRRPFPRTNVRHRPATCGAALRHVGLGPNRRHSRWYCTSKEPLREPTNELMAGHGRLPLATASERGYQQPTSR